MNATTTTAPLTPAQIVGYMIGYVTSTRKFGQTYVHAPVRHASRFCFDVVPARIGDRAVRLSYSSWGRSWQGGGHKYKAHANWSDTGNPVPSKMLHDIIPA
jgi:hypothetical protein